jgi:hypothetical protein
VVVVVVVDFGLSAYLFSRCLRRFSSLFFIVSSLFNWSRRPASHGLGLVHPETRARGTGFWDINAWTVSYIYDRNRN